MRKTWIILFLLVGISTVSFISQPTDYKNLYSDSINKLETDLNFLIATIGNNDPGTDAGKTKIKQAIHSARATLKNADLWLRYLEPVAYKKINGPLPVEWENEVFEKYEKPYKREGAGLSLAEIYLARKDCTRDSLENLVKIAVHALAPFRADSIAGQIDSFDHFYLCNRLYLLNLAAIYTTGFECPDNASIVPELKDMVAGVSHIYNVYNKSFPNTPLTKGYLDAYDKMTTFVNQQPGNFTAFDYYHFIKDYVNPLFAQNQQMIVQYNVASASFNDFTLNSYCNSIFDKTLFTPQNAHGVYSLITDSEIVNEIKATGKQLFFDPILSGNNRRSCASCHNPKEYYAQNKVASSLAFDGINRLPRNTPSLIDATFNHLLMLDGRLYTLQGQGKAVITNPKEMGGTEQDVLDKVMSCKAYRNAFRKYLKYVPEQKEVTFDFIVSAITSYYAEYSDYYAPFDDAMNLGNNLDTQAIAGFNIFMGKGQCGTCHYVPEFNGVPPPYIGSEFEVLGVPADTAYTRLSDDSGRYVAVASFETLHAFRTGSLRNIEFTGPYMHNGVFTTLGQVIDFYDGGGGSGHHLAVPNQTLSADSLRLTRTEKKELLSFLHSLNENIIFEAPPVSLPESSDKALNTRKVGGEY